MKYVSIEQVKESIIVLSKYRNEHHAGGDLYNAMSIAVHIMDSVLENTMEELMRSRGDKLDS